MMKTRLSVVRWLCLWMSVTCALVFVDAQPRPINMMWFGYLTTSQGVLLNNPDVVTSMFIIPLAVKHFNERNGSVLPIFKHLKKCNATINFFGGTMWDDSGLSSTAMRYFVGNNTYMGVDVVQGPVRSTVAQPLAVAAGAVKIPQISHTASSDLLSNKVLYPKFFRTVPSDAQRAKAIAQLFQQWNFSTVGMLYANEAIGVSLRNSLLTECTRRKISVIPVSYESLGPGNASDAEVLKGLGILVAQRLQVILYVNSNADFLYSLAKAAAKLNWVTGKLYVGPTVYFQNTSEIEMDTDLVLKLLNGSLVVMPTIDDNRRWQSLRAIWQTLNASDFQQYIPSNSMIQLPDDFFQRGQEKQLYESWTLAYDSIAAVGLAACGVQQDLYDNLVATDFLGASGPVFFDTSLNRDVSTTSFALINIVVDGTTVSTPQVGVSYSSQNWTFTGTVLFSDGTSIPPLDVIPPNTVVDSIPFGARVFGWIEAAISILLSAGALLYVWCHRTDQVIIESQPFFLEILAFGCIVMASSIIPLTFEDDLGCMLFPWFFAMGFTLVLAALTAKSTRVAILWYHRGPIVQRNKRVRVQVLLLGVVVCLVGMVSILISWQLVAPLEFMIVPQQTDSLGNPLFSSAICSSNSDATTIFFAMVVVYICLVVFGAMWVSFWVRNAPEKYQEARMTAVAGVCMFQVFFVGLPAAAAVWNQALPRFLVLSSITFLLCVVILLTMFVPKIFKSRFSGMDSSQHPVPGDEGGNQYGPGLSRVSIAASRRVRSQVKAIRSDDDDDDTPPVEFCNFGTTSGENRTGEPLNKPTRNDRKVGIDDVLVVQ